MVPIRSPRCRQGAARQGSQEGLCAPAPVRRPSREPLTLGTPAAQWSHICFDPVRRANDSLHRLLSASPSMNTRRWGSKRPCHAFQRCRRRSLDSAAPTAQSSLQIHQNATQPHGSSHRKAALQPRVHEDHWNRLVTYMLASFPSMYSESYPKQFVNP